MSLFKADQREILIAPVDINMLFTVKPSYNQYDNLLSSLSFVLNIECAKPIEIRVRKTDHTDLIIERARKLVETMRAFESRIDFELFERELKSRAAAAAAAAQNNRSRAYETTYEDDTRSYSTLSIMREYELSSFDEEVESVHASDDYVFYPPNKVIFRFSCRIRAFTRSFNKFIIGKTPNQ